MESGVLYVIFNKWIHNPETNEMPYKIGITKTSVADRYYGLGLKMPGKFETLFAYEIDNYAEAEKSIHSIFNKCRINGEWFNLSNDDIEFIKSICLKMDGKLITDAIDKEIETETNDVIVNDDEIGIGSRNMPRTNSSGIDLEELLRTIGKSTFVKYYKQLKNKSLQEVKHLMKISENYATNSLNTKTSVGKKIFREGLERKALKIIIESKNVNDQTRIKAHELLSEDN